MELMTKYRIRHLPVVANARVIGSSPLVMWCGGHDEDESTH